MNMLQQSAEMIPNHTFGIRHVQILLLFLAMTLGFGLKYGMSVAVMSMTNASIANPKFEAYTWTGNQKDLVLSSFFWGYIIMQLPSGYITNVWSSQKLLAIGMLLCGILNVLIPIVAHYGGLEAVLVCRIGMGLAQACQFPCVQTLLAKWAPPTERARLGAFVYLGCIFGIIITTPIAGFLAVSSIGWPSIFYIFGALTIIWSITYFYFGADAPSNHRSISQKERIYIEESLRTTEDKRDEVKQKMKTPWKEIFTSIPLWAVTIAYSAQTWGFMVFTMKIPSFMTGVFNFKIEESGIISALPYLMQMILSFPISWLSDFALKKGVSMSIVRKVSNTVAHWGPAIALTCMSAVQPTDGYIWAIVIFILSMGLNAGFFCSVQVNHIDLSPNFAGTIMSICNCIATITSIVAPVICGMIVTDESSMYQWNIIFYVTAIFFFLGNLVFVIFGTGEIQWWNDPESRATMTETKREKKDKTQI